ncbi:MAG: NAD(P)-binding domain-containing protein, partial [Cyanobacteria bacterium J06598_4]
MRLGIIGCGYVGSRVARLWHEAGNEVAVTTTSPEKVADLEKIASKSSPVRTKTSEAI